MSVVRPDVGASPLAGAVGVRGVSVEVLLRGDIWAAKALAMKTKKPHKSNLRMGKCRLDVEKVS
jgi:hypothetical protein